MADIVLGFGLYLDVAIFRLNDCNPPCVRVVVASILRVVCEQGGEVSEVR